MSVFLLNEDNSAATLTSFWMAGLVLITHFGGEMLNTQVLLPASRPDILSILMVR